MWMNWIEIFQKEFFRVRLICIHFQEINVFFLFHLPKRQNLSVSKDTWPSNSIRTIPFFLLSFVICGRLWERAQNVSITFSLLIFFFFFFDSTRLIWSFIGLLLTACLECIFENLCLNLNTKRKATSRNENCQ